MEEAIHLMGIAYRNLSENGCYVPQRVIMDLPSDNLSVFFKPAYLSSQKQLSIKIITQTGSDPGSNIPTILGLVLLIDTQTGKLLSISDGASITALRTGAASGIATQFLARKDASVGALFGCGAQGRTQIQAVCAVRNMKRFYIYDIHPEASSALKREMQEKVQADIVITDDLEKLSEADIICTATQSKKPLFFRRHLRQGVHINAIGSFKPDMQELDPYLMLESRVFVEQRSSAMTESGDLIIPLQMGLIKPEHIAGELGEVISGQLPGRENEKQLTVFKSVGNAIQDFYLANQLFQHSLEQPGGQEIQLS